jgi:hypothetical protein
VDVGFSETGCPVLAYQMQLDNLCHQAVREKDQKKLRGLLNHILQLLAENQKDEGDVSTIMPIYEESNIE